MGEANSNTSLVVECRELGKTFRDFWFRPRVTAVDNVDLEVVRGEVFGLLGPNGSGKSTIIKMLLGLLFPTRGTIRVLGESPKSVECKARVGYLPEESHLYPFLTARETLEYTGRLLKIPRSERRDRSEQLLDMVGLSAAEGRPVGEYSKGMQRRIGLAQALLNDPELLILDEPTSGLDPLGTRQVKDLILRLHERGTTILVTSHLLADVEELCDRVVVLYGGKVHSKGTLEDLLTNSEESLLRTAALKPDQQQKIEAWLSEQGVALHECKAPRESLESLFLKVVEEATTAGAETSGALAGGELAPFLGTTRGIRSENGTGVATDLEGSSS